MTNLESDQARWAQQCCKGGDCPVCNASEGRSPTVWSIVVEYSNGSRITYNNEVPEHIADAIEEWLDEA